MHEIDHLLNENGRNERDTKPGQEWTEAVPTPPDHLPRHGWPRWLPPVIAAIAVAAVGSAVVLFTRADDGQPTAGPKPTGATASSSRTPVDAQGRPTSCPGLTLHFTAGDTTRDLDPTEVNPSASITATRPVTVHAYATGACADKLSYELFRQDGSTPPFDTGRGGWTVTQTGHYSISVSESRSLGPGSLGGNAGIAVVRVTVK